MIIVAFVASVGQDQAAKNVQPYFSSLLSALVSLLSNITIIETMREERILLQWL